MVRDRDKLLIGALKWLVNRDNLCFHRFGPLVEGVERIKGFIYPLRGLFSSILRYNMLISFNSVSLRKSHTQADLHTGGVLSTRPHRRFPCPLLRSEILQQRPRLLQVSSIKPLTEPAVDFG